LTHQQKKGSERKLSSAKIRNEEGRKVVGDGWKWPSR
jgi:hypothetical protein